MFQNNQPHISNSEVNKEIDNKVEKRGVFGLIKKSLKWGIIISILARGILSLGIVPLLVESFLRPILEPGFFVIINVAELISPDSVLGMLNSVAVDGFAMILGFIIYSGLLFSILIIQERVESIKIRLFAILLTILVFLFITGMYKNLMFTNLLYLFFNFPSQNLRFL